VWRAFAEFAGIVKPPKEVPQEVLDEAWNSCAKPFQLMTERRKCVDRKLIEQGYPQWFNTIEEPETEEEAPVATIELEDLLDDILVGQYFGFILMGIPALFMFLEYKNYRQRKRAKKFFGG